MNPLNDFPSSPLSRASWHGSSRFREHLQVSFVPADIDAPVEHSHFSPDSPAGHLPASSHTPPATSRFSFGSSRSTMYRSPPVHPRDIEKNQFLGRESPRSTATFRDRFTKLFFDVRALSREPEVAEVDVPAEPPAMMSQWPPLHIEKRPLRCPCPRCEDDPARKWRRRAIVSILAAFLLYVLVNLVVLDLRVLAQPRAKSTPQAASTSSSSPLSADAQQCITQYTLNAPTSPTTYPCSTCLPLLSNLSYNYTAVYPAARDATQFCALRALWEDSDANGQAGLEASGWVKDVRFCTWGGVQCDGSGGVSSLQLTFPAVPASIPAEFGNLTHLETLQIIGNNVIPGGSPAQPFASLTKLSSLHIESTGLTAFPDAFSNLTSLTLVKNAQLPSQLPSNFAQLPLQTLIVNNETIALTPDQQSAVCGSQLGGKLQTCDLRGTGVQSCGPCLVG